MTTIDNLMALHNAASHAVVQYALLAQVSLRSERTLQAADDRDEANDALRTALTEALAKNVSLIDEGNKAQPAREPLTPQQYNIALCGVDMRYNWQRLETQCPRHWGI